MTRSRNVTAGRAALERVSLSIAEGEFIAIVGESGSGKTTLLGLVNRLTEPSEGVVRFDGEDVRALDAIGLRRRIGYVFQDIGLFPHMSVAENIGVTPHLLGWDAARIESRVDELLQLVRLPADDYRDRLPRESVRRPAPAHRGRTRHRRRAEVVLMDEPFGALDPLTRDAIGARLPQPARPARPHHGDDHA